MGMPVFSVTVRTSSDGPPMVNAALMRLRRDSWTVPSASFHSGMVTSESRGSPTTLTRSASRETWRIMIVSVWLP